MVRLRLVAWTAGLGAVVAAMVALGDGALAGPDLRSPSSWAAWAQASSTADAVMSVLRIVVLALAAYLLLVTLLGIAFRLGDAGRQMSVLDVVTLPFVRSIVQAGIGVGMVGATVAGVAAQPSPRSAPTRADAAIVAAEPSPAPTMRPIEESTTTSTATVAPAPPGEGAAEAGRPSAPERRAPRTWTVAPGDHLWSIAARSVATSVGREPSDEEVAPYWRALLELNRHVLADPGNPDLLFSGQVLTLPQ
jgi:nucleoid-associated protein YgaU